MLLKPFGSIAVLLLGLCAQAMAGNIDVTGSTFVTLQAGDVLESHFGVWNYAANNPAFSPYPTTIGIQVMGPSPAGALIKFRTGSTAQFFPDYLFDIALDSLDGTVSIPFAAGYLSPGVGTSSLSPDPMAILSASLTLSAAQSQALFGANIGNFDDAAVIRIHNVGQAFTIGLGAPYSAQSAISEPGIGGAGPVQTAGVAGPVIIVAPEPTTGFLVMFGIAGLVLRFKRPFGY